MAKVGDTMRRDMTTVTRAAPLKEVAETLLRTGVRGLPAVDDAGRLVGVVRKGKPVGIVTKHDLLRSIKWREEAESASDEPESA